MTLKEKLLAIANGDTRVPDWCYQRGLCSNIAECMQTCSTQAENLVFKWSRDWPYVSNSPSYPVPYTEKELLDIREACKWFYKTDAMAVYDYHADHGTLYGDSDYGLLRRDLARHIASKLN